MPLTERPRRVLWVLVWISLAALAIGFREILLPFLLGALLAYILHPPVTWISGRRLRGRSLPRWGAVLVIYLAGAALTFAVASLALPHLSREFGRLSAQAREYANGLGPEGMAALADRLAAWSTAHGFPIAIGDDSRPGLPLDIAHSLHGVTAALSEIARGHLLDLLGAGPRLVGHLVGGIFDGALVLMVTAFLLVDPTKPLAFAQGLVPPSAQAAYGDLVKRLDAGLSGVVRGQLTICIINGSLTFVGLTLLRVPFAYALALLATVFSFIPIFGTLLSSVPVVLVALGGGWHVGLGMLAWLVGIHNLEAYVLNPKVMGDASRLHPLLIVFALMAGEHYFGLIGAVFAVPTASLAASIFQDLHARLAPPTAERYLG